MRYVVWALRLVVFVVVLLFALKNTDPVEVNFFADHVLPDVPLVIVMLVAFLLGLVLGLVIMILSLMRKKNEIAKLKREKSRLEEQLKKSIGEVNEASATSAVNAKVIAPLAPL